MRIHEPTKSQTHMYTHTHKPTEKHAYTYLHKQTYKHTRINKPYYTLAHTNTHTHTHTHIHTHTQTLEFCISGVGSIKDKIIEITV